MRRLYGCESICDRLLFYSAARAKPRRFLEIPGVAVDWLPGMLLDLAKRLASGAPSWCVVELHRRALPALVDSSPRSEPGRLLMTAKIMSGSVCFEPISKSALYQGHDFSRAPGVSTYFGVANWPAEDIFAVFRSTNRLSCASPGLLVRGSGFSTRMNAPVYRFRALALVAGGPVLSPERPMTTRTAPVSRSSPL